MIGVARKGGRKYSYLQKVHLYLQDKMAVHLSDSSGLLSELTSLYIFLRK